jgi:hypothetical protein
LVPRNGNWLQTYTGIKFYPLDPKPEEVDINDVAHALSLLCRYGGHCREFYSVAEHSFHASYLVPPEHALTALMHDATEAYLVDVPRPIKKYLTNYVEIEDELWRVIAGKWGMPAVMPQCVHDADVAMLFAERDQIVEHASDVEWGMGLVTPVTARPRITCLSPRIAERLFLRRFEALLP